MKIDLKKLLLIIFVVIAVLIGIFYVFFIMEPEKQDISGLSVKLPDETEIAEVTVTPAPVPLIRVFVCGAVNSEGVYSLPEGSIVNDAVKAAGGFSDAADRDYINLARALKDNERIYVPTEEETKSLTTVEEIKGTGVSITSEETTGTAGSGTEAVTGVSGAAALININTAGISELTALPGIGEARAKDIVSYRTNVGLFRTIDDIKNVSGIGEKMFLRLKAYITVD